MAKTLDDYWIDWESTAFGFGYGTGEPHVIPALRRFLELCNEGPPGHSYDHRVLERELSPSVAWLLINVLGRRDIITYGTSPRFAWLTRKGERLREYMLSKTADELVALTTSYGEDHAICYPDACNCGPNGYDAQAVCPNPFWRD